ncbi:TIGR02449 family protein [Thioflexithrix psekupsensis]|uniref:TIGR02449 family protein n=1 Tax=Thioflexithrix psekupsensis TaxID=1570016 RepID=A0A251X3T2_9GAMM|nr:TIGR02449 family protein [Thioflexithrix psekupsensis]OUD12015.1 TIGR02449 family protein [Thioflexithrix psekupsensis]
MVDFQRLEHRIEELVNLCTQLADENQALRVQQAQWLSERASLLEKNALARSRIEAMITRLKTMEDNGV